MRDKQAASARHAPITCHVRRSANSARRLHLHNHCRTEITVAAITSFPQRLPHPACCARMACCTQSIRSCQRHDRSASSAQDRQARPPPFSVIASQRSQAWHSLAYQLLHQSSAHVSGARRSASSARLGAIAISPPASPHDPLRKPNNTHAAERWRLNPARDAAAMVTSAA